MANKGYWITVGKLTSPQGLNSYVEVLVKWLPIRCDAHFNYRFGSIEKEGSTGHSTVVIEFPFKRGCYPAYESPEYQDIIAMRLLLLSSNSQSLEEKNQGNYFRN